jgi:hypothetical protein
MYALGIVWASDFNCKPLLNLVLLFIVPMWFLCSFADCSTWTIAGNYIIAVCSLLGLLFLVVFFVFQKALSNLTCHLWAVLIQDCSLLTRFKTSEKIRFLNCTHTVMINETHVLTFGWLTFCGELVCQDYVREATNPTAWKRFAHEVIFTGPEKATVLR